MADGKHILVLGSQSTLAREFVDQYIDEFSHITLVARNAEKLQVQAADLESRSKTVHTKCIDFNEIGIHQEFDGALDDIDEVYFFYGSLPDQQACEQSVESALEAINLNFVSSVAMLTSIANQFEQKRAGLILVVTSVAGDRGRKANYVYGASKAGLTAYCQGLRNRLASAGVRVVTVKPGMFKSAMTEGMPKTPAILWSDTDRIAKVVVEAATGSKEVVYAPGYWRIIMWVIKSIPERIFKNTSI